MPRTLSRLLLPLLACAALLAGCDSMPTRATSDAVLAAERDYARGDFARAAQGFLDAAENQRNQRDTLRLRAAEAWREEGEMERAAGALEGISTRRFDADAQQRLGLLQAEIALARRQPEQALTLLDGIAAQATASHRARLLELRARAAEAGDNLFLAATARAELDAALPQRERGENTRAIASLLARLDDDALAFGAASLPAAHALYPHAARALIARGLPLPRPYSGDLLPGGERAQADIDGYRPFTRVALLLPLDGALGNAAQAVRDGFIAGYYEETRNRPEVRVYATGNSPETALNAYRTALRDGAQAIVGPLGREDVAAIFEASHESAVPLLALNRGGTTPPSPGSMSFALTPEDEGIAAANRIAERSGGLRVLAVRGDDEYGQRASAALAQRLEQRGGRVAATVHLPEGSPNFGPAIGSAIAQIGARAVPAAGDTRIQQNRVQIEADAIFFAGRAEQARLLVPQLRLAGIYDLPIYATSQITAGAGDARLDRELDGIEFTEAPWLIAEHLPGSPRRDTLAALETTRGGGVRLFAFGLDAFRLIGYFEHLARDPQAVISGATGQLRYDGFGQVLRTPGWARFQGGRIQPAREAAGLIGDELQFRQP